LGQNDSQPEADPPPVEKRVYELIRLKTINIIIFIIQNKLFLDHLLDESKE